MRIIKQKNSKTKKISVPKGTAFLGSRRVILRNGAGTQSMPPPPRHSENASRNEVNVN